MGQARRKALQNQTGNTDQVEAKEVIPAMQNLEVEEALLASSTLSRSESKDPVARRAALAVPYLEMIARQVDVRDKAEDTIAQGVAAARLQGATWAQCGQALGITREGAFKRFGSQGPEALPRSLQGDRLDGPDSLA